MNKNNYDYEIKQAQFRGEVVKALEVQDKNVDILFKKLNKLDKYIDEINIKNEGFSKDIKALIEINKQKNKQKKWIYGLVIGFIIELMLILVTWILRGI